MTESDWEIVPRPIGFESLLPTLDTVQPQSGSRKSFGYSPGKEKLTPTSEFYGQLQFDGGRSIGKSTSREQFDQNVDSDIQG